MHLGVLICVLHSGFRQIKDPAADSGGNIAAAASSHNLQAQIFVALFERLDLMALLEGIKVQASFGSHQGQYGL
jgi:hypothetical protein